MSNTAVHQPPAAPTAARAETPGPAAATSALRGVGYAAGTRALQPKPEGAAKPEGTKNAKAADPYTVKGSDDRFEITPTKPNGKTLYFFFGYKGTEKDKGMRSDETSALEGNVYGAARRGFKVVYDKGGTKAEFLAAAYDADCSGIYWSGHGYMNGGIQTSDGQSIGPADVVTASVSKNLQYLILAACGSAIDAAGWKKAMGPQCQFEGWVPTTTASEANDFQTEASVGYSWVAHGGTNSNKELRHYMNDAERAPKK